MVRLPAHFLTRRARSLSRPPSHIFRLIYYGRRTHHLHMSRRTVRSCFAQGAIKHDFLTYTIPQLLDLCTYATLDTLSSCSPVACAQCALAGRLVLPSDIPTAVRPRSPVPNVFPPLSDRPQTLHVTFNDVPRLVSVLTQCRYSSTVVLTAIPNPHPGSFSSSYAALMIVGCSDPRSYKVMLIRTHGMKPHLTGPLALSGSIPHRVLRAPA
jgi:hypothetical protein